MDSNSKDALIIELHTSRMLTPEAEQAFFLGLEIWKKWGVNGGLKSVLLPGGKKPSRSTKPKQNQQNPTLKLIP